MSFVWHRSFQRGGVLLGSGCCKRVVIPSWRVVNVFTTYTTGTYVYISSKQQCAVSLSILSIVYNAFCYNQSKLHVYGKINMIIK